MWPGRGATTTPSCERCSISVSDTYSRGQLFIRVCVDRYHVIVAVLVYLLPLALMAVTYTRVGLVLWGGGFPGHSSENLQDHLQAKRKVLGTQKDTDVFSLMLFKQRVFGLVFRLVSQTSDEFSAVLRGNQLNFYYGFLYFSFYSNKLNCPTSNSVA